MSRLSAPIQSDTAYQPLKATSRHQDIELVSNSARSRDKVILQVVDAPFDGSLAQSRAVLCFGDDIDTGLKRLPEHAAGTARILDITVHSDFVKEGLRDAKGPKTTEHARETLIRYLQDTYAQSFEERRIFRWLDDPLLVNDIGSIAAQWSQHPGSGNSSHTHLYRVVNRSSLQQHPLDHDVRPRDSYLTSFQDGRGRLIVIMVHDVWWEQQFAVNRSQKDYIAFENPRSIEKMLTGDSWTSFSDGKPETFAKLLLLDFFLASIYLQPVDYYSELIYPRVSENAPIQISLTHNPHLQVPLGLFEPRLSAKSKEAFQEIGDTEGILRSVNNLVDSIRFVLSSLSVSRLDKARQNGVESCKRRQQKLQSLCAERGSNAKRALDALNRQLDYLTKRHAIREAKAIRTLTILASLYLPLSLAAALLSMSNPFKFVAHTITGTEDDEVRKRGTNLLFDFFGLFITIASFSIFVVHVIRFTMWVRSNGFRTLSRRTIRVNFSLFDYGRRWRVSGRMGKIFDCIRGFTKWWIGAGVLIVLVVVFIFGMQGQPQMAWHLARTLFIIYIVVGGIAGLACVIIYRVLSRQRLRPR